MPVESPKRVNNAITTGGPVSATFDNSPQDGSIGVLFGFVGGASIAARHDGRSYFVYSTVVPRGTGSTPTYAATYDETTGTLTVTDKAGLDACIDRYARLFASLTTWDRQSDIAVVPAYGA
mgnify:CR=1 FL=1